VWLRNAVVQQHPHEQGERTFVEDPVGGGVLGSVESEGPPSMPLTAAVLGPRQVISPRSSAEVWGPTWPDRALCVRLRTAHRGYRGGAL
jgi:hypothetical protein